MPPEGLNFPDIAKAFSLSFDRQRGQTQAVADEAQTTQQVQNQQASIKQKIQELQNSIDPSAYKKVRKEDGGFDFFDPQGNQVDIATISDKTGTRPQDWIDDSENPIDVQYRNDYANLQDFMDAVLSKDKTKVDGYVNADPQLKRYTAGRGGINQLLEDFRRSYQRFYTPRSEDPQAWGRAPSRVVVPAAQSGPNLDLGVGGSGI